VTKYLICISFTDLTHHFQKEILVSKHKQIFLFSNWNCTQIKNTDNNISFEADKGNEIRLNTNSL